MLRAYEPVATAEMFQSPKWSSNQEVFYPAATSTPQYAASVVPDGQSSPFQHPQHQQMMICSSPSVTIVPNQSNFAHAIPTAYMTTTVPTTVTPGYTPTAFTTDAQVPYFAGTNFQPMAAHPIMTPYPAEWTNSTVSSSPSSRDSPTPEVYDDRSKKDFESQNMHIVWHREFNKFFDQFKHFGHEWELYAKILNPHFDLSGWESYTEYAKVRFTCQECRHGWTSAWGAAVFWFKLDVASNKGYVLFELKGQRCEKCNLEEFALPWWYADELPAVMSKIYHKVAELAYKFKPNEHVYSSRARKTGRPKRQHNRELCQSCAEGVCRYANDSFSFEGRPRQNVSR